MRRRLKTNLNEAQDFKETDNFKKNQRVADPMKDENRSLYSDFKICLGCSVVIFAIYAFTLHPSVAGGDSGELIIAAYELGVAHPPGYPLFTILSKLFITLIPVNSVAWRVNLMSALFSALSSLVMQMTVLRITRCIGTSLLVFALFSLNDLTWAWSTCAEVFTLNNLFASLIVFIMVWIDGGSDQGCVTGNGSGKLLLKKVYLLAFICGLSLTNQHTIIFFVVFVALWAVHKLYQANLLTIKTLTILTAVTVTSLSPYLHLPVSSYLNQSRWSWGDEGSFGGFLTHVLRMEYGTFDLSKGTTGSGFQNALRLYLYHLQHRMCELCPWLALIGLVTSVSWCFVNKLKSVLLLSVMTLSYLCFFCWRANLDLTDSLLVGVVERFWMQADIGFVILACIGYHTAIRLVVEKFLGNSKITLTTVFTTMGSLILVSLQLQNNFGKCDNSGNYVVRDFARSILKNMPKDALVLVKGDLPSLSLQYLHMCEGYRPDVDIVDVEILSYDWSIGLIKKFQPRVIVPGDVWNLQKDSNEGVNDRRAFNFKMFLDENVRRRKVFSCVDMQDKDPSWTPHYKTWPYGVCHSIQHITDHLDPKIWANKTGGLADKWNYKYDGFDKRSWEKAANDEMWHAKIATAFFLYKLGTQSKDNGYNAELFLHSYELYFRAIKLHQHPSRMTHVETFPSFWHKNFALVCERLLHVNTPQGVDKIKLCKSSIFHFEQYLHITPDDEDANSIKEAIQILKQRLDVFNNFKKVDETLEKAAQRLDKLDEIADKIRNATYSLE